MIMPFGIAAVLGLIATAVWFAKDTGNPLMDKIFGLNPLERKTLAWIWGVAAILSALNWLMPTYEAKIALGAITVLVVAIAGTYWSAC